MKYTQSHRKHFHSSICSETHNLSWLRCFLHMEKHGHITGAALETENYVYDACKVGWPDMTVTTALKHIKNQASGHCINTTGTCGDRDTASHQEPSWWGHVQDPSLFTSSAPASGVPPYPLWCWTRFTHRRFPVPRMFTYHDSWHNAFPHRCSLSDW